jgi:transcriptional regulator with PAS, ATPase and Fis domain
MPPRGTGYDNRDATLDDFVSSDGPMQACLERARMAARTDLPVLIVGESGTGKTILARAIHNSSARSHGAFVSFNAAALSETLIDSQLFGHERGAFTGAQSRVKGKFELADGGTLFLDEIADLSSQGQSKILRAIEYGEFERLGSETLRQANVRVLSATHHPVAALTRSNGFREDLLFRINGITVVVPPLRARPQDLRALVAHEIARASQAQGKAIVGLDRAAADRLLGYPWPGNLRELSKVIQAAVALTTGPVIAGDVLLLQADAADGPAESAGNGATRASLRLKDAIHAHIRFVLGQVQGNKRRAARELGVGRETLARKLREMEDASRQRRRR